MLALKENMTIHFQIKIHIKDKGFTINSFGDESSRIYVCTPPKRLQHSLNSFPKVEGNKNTLTQYVGITFATNLIRIYLLALLNLFQNFVFNIIKDNILLHPPMDGKPRYLLVLKHLVTLKRKER